MDSFRHGTSAGYAYHKCRCDECRAYQREYMRRRRGSALTALPPVSKKAYNAAVKELVSRHRDELLAIVTALGEVG